MIVFSPSIGRYVRLRDLPAQDLIALRDAVEVATGGPNLPASVSGQLTHLNRHIRLRRGLESYA